MRTIREFMSLVSQVFHIINKGLAVNLEQVDDIRLSNEKPRTLGFVFDNPGDWNIEYVIVSRSKVQQVRKRFAMQERA